VNDLSSCPIQLHAPAKNVRIVNCTERFPSLGAKRNYAISQALGEYVFTWDDDDLYLPWRMSASIQYLQANPNFNAVKPTKAVTSVNNGEFDFVHGGFHSQICIRRSAFDSVQYPPELSCGEDQQLEALLVLGLLDVDPLFWSICRWGLGIYHISGRGDADQDGNWRACGEYIESLGATDAILKPRFSAPHWDHLDEYLFRSLDGAAYKRWKQAVGPYLYTQ
jgi:glycosyltransferase involved in cell wall biosynthesis